jgi:hypothetical protein
MLKRPTLGKLHALKLTGREANARLYQAKSEARKRLVDE